MTIKINNLNVNSESSDLCEDTRACLDPNFKNQGQIPFTLT